MTEETEESDMTETKRRGRKASFRGETVARRDDALDSEARAARRADHRARMIAEAAYERAARRVFAPGRELDDWFEAEHEIDRRTAPH